MMHLESYLLHTCVLTQLVGRRLYEAVDELQCREDAIDVVLLAQRCRHVPQLHWLPVFLQALTCRPSVHSAHDGSP